MTACHVARELRFTRTKTTLVLSQVSSGEWSWVSVDQSEAISLEDTERQWHKLTKERDLCLTGEGVVKLHAEMSRLFERVLPHVRVFARVAPKQKELVITSLRALGFTTLMCGDGTNDVGALKHANVGKEFAVATIF